MRLEALLDEHRKSPLDKNSKTQVLQNYKEKEDYLNFEVCYVSKLLSEFTLALLAMFVFTYSLNIDCSFQLKRYRTYSYMLRTKICQYPELNINFLENSIGEVDEASGNGKISTKDDTMGIVPLHLPHKPSPTINRHSYRQAIYNRNTFSGGVEIG